MCVDDNPEACQVLTAVEHEDTNYYDGEKLLRFTYLSGARDYLYYTKKCRVIVVNLANDLLAYGVKCDNCGTRYGNHYCKGDARKNGISCHSTTSGEWFVPNESSLWDFHRDDMNRAYNGGKSDFFASIGL